MSVFKCLSLNDSIRMEKEKSSSFTRWKKRFKLMRKRQKSPTPRKHANPATPKSSPAASYYELCLKTPPDFYETSSASTKYKMFQTEDSGLLGFLLPQGNTSHPSYHPSKDEDAQELSDSSGLSIIFEESDASDRDVPRGDVDEETSQTMRGELDSPTPAEFQASIPAAKRLGEAHPSQIDNSSEDHAPKKSNTGGLNVENVVRRFEFETSQSYEADNEESNSAGSCWSKSCMMHEASTRKTESDVSKQKTKMSLDAKELESLLSEKGAAILKMEYNYLKAINSGIDRYCGPLRRWTLSEKQHSFLFQNIEELANTSAAMLEQMLKDSKCLTSHSTTEQPRASFPALTKVYRSKMLRLGELHQNYGEGLDRANELLDKLGQEKEFAAFVEARAATSQGHESLREFINTPRQYFLQLSSHFVDVSLAMPSDHPEFSLLQETVDLLWESFLVLLDPAKAANKKKKAGDRSPKIFACV